MAIDPTRAGTLAYLLNQKAVATALGPISTSSKNFAWAATEAAKILSELAGATPPAPPTLTPQQMVDAAIAAAKDGDIINFGAGDFSATISKGASQ